MDKPCRLRSSGHHQKWLAAQAPVFWRALSTIAFATRRMLKMIDIAAHLSTPDGEAINALRLLRSVLEPQRIAFLDIVRVEGSEAEDMISELTKENGGLRDELRLALINCKLHLKTIKDHEGKLEDLERLMGAIGPPKMPQRRELARWSSATVSPPCPNRPPTTRWRVASAMSANTCGPDWLQLPVAPNAVAGPLPSRCIRLRSARSF